ncbi:SDR family NAD(P)-dependent oxidoreductase [Roseisolibacter sp. H3M3-2]|nr:SDR family NAD(P)-dependent oxidoreductase [Roseisolibacter sp. H3M3-2]
MAVVTGPTAGIGRVFAERLAARGHDLVLVSRDAARLRALADELSARHGVACEAAAHDLADAAAVEALAAALAAMPRLDVLVNNAGFGTLGTLERADPAAQAAMVQLHCATPVRLAQAALPAMLARGAGAIVNVASVAAFVTGPGNATYSGTKAFVRLWSEGLAAEVQRRGVAVQALCPGFTRTEFHQRMGFAPTRIPAALWLTAESVVDASLRALDRGGPVTVVPGLRYKLAIAAVRLLPLRVFSAVVQRGPRTRT